MGFLQISIFKKLNIKRREDLQFFKKIKRKASSGKEEKNPTLKKRS